MLSETAPVRAVLEEVILNEVYKGFENISSLRVGQTTESFAVYVDDAKPFKLEDLPPIIEPFQVVDLNILRSELEGVGKYSDKFIEGVIGGLQRSSLYNGTPSSQR